MQTRNTSKTSKTSNTSNTSSMDFSPSEYVASWVSVEHDVNWAKRVRRILARLPWGDKVSMKIITVGLVEME